MTSGEAEGARLEADLGQYWPMHLTGTEIELVPSVVAAIAIIGGYLGVRSASGSQLLLARDSYVRDRLTETYLSVLKGVHIRGAQLKDAYERPVGQGPRTPQTDNAPTAPEETLLGAQLLAYASPKLAELWRDFASETDRYFLVLEDLRGQTGARPKDFRGNLRDYVEKLHDRWADKRDELQSQIRMELRNPAMTDARARHRPFRRVRPARARVKRGQDVQSEENKVRAFGPTAESMGPSSRPTGDLDAVAD